MSYIGTEPKDIRSFGRTKFDYTATQGQTAFTGADDDGKVLAFTVGQIEVYVNGILMDDSDFTTTGTGTVTLATAANLNDVINIVSFETNIPDSNYVPATGGTFSGDVDFGANKITYANVYSQLSDLPSASTYHGMFAHVHATGLAYYAHAGAWIPLANTTGATFSGNIVASDGINLGGTGAANKLEDYEEGTWTPNLGGSGASYDIQSGAYVKVGDLVHIRFALRPTNMGSGTTTYKVLGLPFTVGALTGLSIGYYDGAATNHYSILGYVENNQIEVFMKTSAINSAQNSLNFFQTNARIYASATYRTS